MALLFSILKLLEAKAILLSLQQKKITLKVNLTVYLLFKKIITWVFFCHQTQQLTISGNDPSNTTDIFLALVKCDATFWIISWVDYIVRSVSSPFFLGPRFETSQKKVQAERVSRAIKFLLVAFTSQKFLFMLILFFGFS